MRSVQISEELFLLLTSYHLAEMRDTEREAAIHKGLSDKLEAILKHYDFTTYKTATTVEEREKARKAYLERSDISEGFRW